MMMAIRPLSSWDPALGDWELAEARADFRGSRTFPQGVLVGDGSKLTGRHGEFTMAQPAGTRSSHHTGHLILAKSEAPNAQR